MVPTHIQRQLLLFSENHILTNVGPILSLFDVLLSVDQMKERGDLDVRQLQIWKSTIILWGPTHIAYFEISGNNLFET